MISICSGGNKHPEVAYEGNDCPMCADEDRIDELVTELKVAEDKIEELEEENKVLNGRSLSSV